jgi:histone deacetylase 6
MAPLPISKADVANFQDQVFCSKDFYNKKTLVLFIHDAPDVVIGTNTTLSNTMDLNEAFLVNTLGYAVLNDSWTLQTRFSNGPIRWILDWLTLTYNLLMRIV